MEDELPPGYVEAAPFLRALIARDMLAAREHAGLTPDELAAALGTSAEHIRGTESGEVVPSEEHIASVLAACGLPADWTGQSVGHG